MSQPAGLILSGGASSRMREPKALLKIGGKTLLEDQVCRLKGSGARPIFVVVGADSKGIIAAHEDLDVIWVENQDWELGNFSSILCGLKKIFKSPTASKCDGVILLPIDVAAVDSKTIRSIITTGLKMTQSVVPTYDTKGGHPVFLASNMVNHILSKSSEDNRLDHILKSDKQTIMLEVKDRAILNNINTEADYVRLIKCIGILK